MYFSVKTKEKILLLAFALLVLTAQAHVPLNTLPETYPAVLMIPPIIDSYINQINWQSSPPASIIRTCPETGDWGLTYDDGPTLLSSQLLDHLKAAGIKATFFVIGGNVINNPDILKRMHAEGHEIGLHTWSHLHINDKQNTPEHLVMELGWNIKAIHDLIGVSPRFFRPPYGELNPNALKVIGAFGLTVVMWDGDRDTNDWNTTIDKKKTLMDVKQKWIPGLKTRGMIGLEHEMTQGQIDLAIEIIDAAKHAHVIPGPVGTCLGFADDEWYQDSTGILVDEEQEEASTNASHITSMSITVVLIQCVYFLLFIDQ